MYIYTYQCLFQMGYLSKCCINLYQHDVFRTTNAMKNLLGIMTDLLLHLVHFKPKPKRSHGNVSTEQSEFQPEFTIFVPLKLYADAPVKSIGSSQSRGYTIRYVKACTFVLYVSFAPLIIWVHL